MMSIVKHQVYGKSKRVVEDFTRTPWQHKPSSKDTENFFITKDKKEGKDNDSIN